MPSEGFESVTLNRERYLGLKQRADRENRSISNMLDEILKDAEIPALTDKQFERAKEKEETVA